jgi:hypothetical protein
MCTREGLKEKNVRDIRVGHAWASVRKFFADEVLAIDVFGCVLGVLEALEPEVLERGTEYCSAGKRLVSAICSPTANSAVKRYIATRAFFYP